VTKALLSVEEALSRILAAATPLGEEKVPLAECLGRTLAADLAAARTQPPVDVSAMDGYAVRSADLAEPGQRVRLVGESSAGQPYSQPLHPGEAVRIFTGAAVPTGADTILIQELADVEAALLGARETPRARRHIRSAGLDFRAGDVLLKTGQRLGAAELALAAAMDHAVLPVARRPRVALLATGDELVRPGSGSGPDTIVASNTYAVAALITLAGGVPVDLGIVKDDLPAVEAAIEQARAAAVDVLVTLGGASVGDYDLVKPALAKQGMSLAFWRIAMRPGKPLIHGSLGPTSVLGLPGNPVSAIVCAYIFLVPLLRALLGDPQAGEDRSEIALTGAALPAGDHRQDYLRARLGRDGAGRLVATPLPLQDSSMLRALAEADCLLIREPHAPVAEAGTPCRILRLKTEVFASSVGPAG
jgi:molybdopterin molybdotransferase